MPKWKPPKVDAFGTVEALFPDWGDVGISFSESGKDKLGRASVKSVKPGSKAPPEVCPGIVLISVHDERDGTRQTTGMSYEEQIKAIRNAGRPMKLTFQPPESAVPRGRLKPAVPGDVLVCLKPQVLRQGPEKGANQCRWSLQQGARVVVDVSPAPHILTFTRRRSPSHTLTSGACRAAIFLRRQGRAPDEDHRPGLPRQNLWRQDLRVWRLAIHPGGGSGEDADGCGHEVQALRLGAAE